MPSGMCTRPQRGTYGAPRVHAELKLGLGIRCGRKRVERLMRWCGLAGVTRRARRGCTRRDPAAGSSGDLVNRKFAVSGPDRLWCADITEHPTGQGKVYATVVIDAWSRRVVGLSIADHLRAELVTDALQMAIWQRGGRGSRDHPPFRPRHPVHLLGVRAAATPGGTAGLDGDRR